jgi:hypothetical protein
VVGLQTMLENAANEAGKAIATKLIETFRQPTEQSDGEVGYTVGTFSGQIIFEIVLAVFTAGLGGAVAAGKAGIRAVVQGIREVLRLLGIGRRGQRFAVDGVLFAYRHLRGFSNYVKAVFAGWLEKSPALQRLYSGVLHLIDRVWNFVERLKQRIDEALEKRRRRSEADAPDANDRPRNERPDGDEAPDGDRTPEQRRMAAVAEAYALVAAEDVRGASVAEVLALLKTRFLRRGRGISDFGYNRVGARLFDFWYTASPPTDFYSGYDEEAGENENARMPDAVLRETLDSVRTKLQELREIYTDRRSLRELVELDEELSMIERLRGSGVDAERSRLVAESFQRKVRFMEARLKRHAERPERRPTRPGEVRVRESDFLYEIEDVPNRFYAQGSLVKEKNGQHVLELNFKLADDATRSGSIQGREAFNEIIEHFTQPGAKGIDAIRGRWGGRIASDNAIDFNEYLRVNNYADFADNRAMQDQLIREAARITWTGQQAARHGFTRVSAEQIRRDSQLSLSRNTPFLEITVLFFE